MPPLLILVIGLAVVVGMIVLMRLNAFFALITAALVVSLLAEGELGDKIPRVASAFGATAGSIGIVIALAAVVGVAMLESGAADRIVRWFLDALGEQRASMALLASGFVLAVPVFFDTVFYLLVPLARSMCQRTGRDYLKYVMVIASGALVTHSLVPPTPGPLVNADNLGVDLGTMIMVGLLVGMPAAIVGIVASGWISRKLDVPMRPLGDEESTRAAPDHRLPLLGLALLPILLPVVMISANTIAQAIRPGTSVATWTAVLGNPNLAMLLAAAASLSLYVRQRNPTTEEVTRLAERSLMSGGLIILITAAGGAFGAMLQVADVGTAVEGLFGGSGQASGLLLLVLGFAIASLLKFAQGSSTVAMIAGSAMLASMITPETLGFHPVYIATAVGSGSMVGVWMNDSGFWIISKMGVLTEVETLRSWSVVSALLGLTGLVTTLLLALLMPLA